MDEERLRWITRNPPTLDGFRIQVTFPPGHQTGVAALTANGWCDRKRGNLWTHEETIELAGGRYSLHDLISHLALVAQQDRPVSNAALTRGLNGSAWEQPEFPF